MRKLKQESLDAAFTKLYEETYDSVLRYIICRCAAPSDIGDLVQNTYLALYQRLRRSGEPVRDPQHYVMRIARNELYHHYGAASMLRNCLPVFPRTMRRNPLKPSNASCWMWRRIQMTKSSAMKFGSSSPVAIR